MMTKPLTIKNLVKKFGGLTATDDISFDLNEGQSTGLLGLMEQVKPQFSLKLWVSIAKHREKLNYMVQKFLNYRHQLE